MVFKNNPLTQTKDGKWIPAQPIPYYRDTRSLWRKIIHTIKTIKICFIFDNQLKTQKEDELEVEIDKWMVPVEPYTDINGKWKND